MEKIKSWISAYWIVLLFALAKLVVHLITATNYGFQRDAYLYMAQSKHLDWGFFSTPPLVAFVTWIHTMLWGESLLAVRLLPALIGVISIFTGMAYQAAERGSIGPGDRAIRHLPVACLSQDLCPAPADSL